MATLKERLAVAESRVIGDEDLWTLLLCSLRYSLGRQSYMPSLYQDIAKGFARRLLPERREQIADEVEEYLSRVSADLENRRGFVDILNSWDSFARYMRSIGRG